MNLLISQLILILISKKEHRLHLKPHLQNHQHQHLIVVDPNYLKHLQLRELHQEIHQKTIEKSFENSIEKSFKESFKKSFEKSFKKPLKKSFDFKNSSSSYA